MGEFLLRRVARKAAVAGVTAVLVALGTGVVATDSARAEGCGGDGRTWPGSGQVNMNTSPRYEVTFTFSLSASELCELRKSEYLEIQYTLFGFSVPSNWSNYSVDNADLPGAKHDVDYANEENKPYPAVTAIRTKDLVASRRYRMTLSWDEPLLVGTGPQIKFVWVPSHWRRKTVPAEARCEVVHAWRQNPGWCIFADDGKEVTLFGDQNFQNGTKGGIRQLTSHGSFTWSPSFGTPPFVISAGSVPTPPAGNRLPFANFTYTRLTGPGNKISLNSSSSRDPDGRIVAWTWYKGIPSFSSAPNPTLSLGAATSAIISLTVTDDRGGTAMVTKTIRAGNRRPILKSVSPAGGTVSGTNAPTLSATAADDDADPLQYFFRIHGPSVDVSSGWMDSSQWKVPAYKLDPGTQYTWTVQARDSRGASSDTKTTAIRIAVLPTASDLLTTSTGKGYWQVARDGGVFAFGDAPFHGSLPGLNIRLNNIIGMARTSDNGGYWLVGSDGGVFAFGDASFHGSMAGRTMNGPVVGMAPTKSGNGYWLVGSDGGVFSFGDAAFYGSMGGKHLNKPVTAIASTPSSEGYWLVAEDGGVFAFGDAPFYGSMGGKPLNAPVVDMDMTPSGAGYWLTAEDGGVFAFGDAPFYGSMAGQHLNGHITGMSATVTGQGYWLNGCDGGVFAFGNAAFYGSKPTYQCRGT